MVREIMKDVFFLAQKSDPATKADLQVARDILDTLKAHTDECDHLEGINECDHLEGIII